MIESIKQIKKLLKKLTMLLKWSSYRIPNKADFLKMFMKFVPKAKLNDLNFSQF